MEEFDINILADQEWEETIDFLTSDMPPSEIDIKVLANRYREYVNEMQEHDLSVSAKAIRICSALLSMKAAINFDYTDELEDEAVPNPMDFEEPLEDEMEEEENQGRNPDLGNPPELKMPPKPKPRRRMHKSELKDALRSAMEVKDKREERQREREEMDAQFEFDEEETIRDKMNNLYNRVTSLVSGGTEKGVRFDQLLEKQTSEEKIDKFMQVLTLENDKKVTCKQEEFLGDIHVHPEDNENDKVES